MSIFCSIFSNGYLLSLGSNPKPHIWPGWSWVCPALCSSPRTFSLHDVIAEIVPTVGSNFSPLCHDFPGSIFVICHFSVLRFQEMQEALSKELRITGIVYISGKKIFICISHIIPCKYNYFYLIWCGSFQYVFTENLYITSTVQELGVQKWLWHPFTSRTSQFGGENK